MLRGLNNLGRACHDRGHLLAQDDEDQAVGDELHRIPDNRAADTRGRHGRTLTLGEAHGYASRDRSQNARSVDGFGRQIGCEGHQQADQDLTADILAPATADPAFQQTNR
ncbi:hypothetical protein D3C80_1017740 [compost metagenome]